MQRHLAKLGKCIAIWILTLAVTISLVPTGFAFAEDGDMVESASQDQKVTSQEAENSEAAKQKVTYRDNAYETLAEALTAVDATDEDEDVLTLTADIELDETLVIDKAVTIDLNGHRIVTKAVESDMAVEAGTTTDAAAATETAVDAATTGETADPVVNTGGTADAATDETAEAATDAPLLLAKGVTVTLTNSSDDAGIIENGAVDADAVQDADATTTDAAMSTECTAMQALSTETVQDIAGEFVLSETVKVEPAEGWQEAAKIALTKNADGAEGNTQDADAIVSEIVDEAAKVGDSTATEQASALQLAVSEEKNTEGEGTDEEEPAPEPTYKVTLRIQLDGADVTGTSPKMSFWDGEAGKYVSKNIGGSATVSKKTGIKKGETITVNSIPQRCYGVESIKVNGKKVGKAKKQKVTINKNTTIVVNFVRTGTFVMVDAGHGSGELNCSPFLIGGTRYYEYLRMWELSKYLVDELNEYPDIMAFNTKATAAATPAVVTRGKYAKNCDLFVSLHSNACNSESVNYVTVLVPDGNAMHSKVVGLATNMGKTVTNTMNSGKKIIYSNPFNWRRNPGASYETWGVIRGARSVGVPGILIEHSFHTNKAATKWLLSNKNLKKLAVAEAADIAKWGGSGPKNTSAKPVSKITIKGTKKPTTLTKGTKYTVAGTISSLYDLKRVEVGIVDKKTGSYVTGHYYNNTKVNAKTFDIGKAAAAMKFQTLPAGEYYYRIWAHDTNGKVQRMMNHAFTVRKSSIYATGYNYPKTLKKGGAFFLKGTLKSTKYNIKRVEIGVVSAKTGKWTKQKYDRSGINAKTFDIKKADPYILFPKLAKGKYYYRIWVHPTKGKAVRVVNRAFTVK